MARARKRKNKPKVIKGSFGIIRIEPKSARYMYKPIKRKPYGKNKNTRYAYRVKRGVYVYKTKKR